jgi:dUTPase
MSSFNPDILLNIYPRYMHLRVFVDENPELYNMYLSEIQLRNQKIYQNMNYIDAGFDLFVPFQKVCDANPIINEKYAPEGHNCTSNPVCNKFDFGIKCSARIIEAIGSNQPIMYNTGYYLHPRSSVSKGPLRLANSTGIIDAGYRGRIIGMFDSTAYDFMVQRFDRIAQICAPGLMPIYVELVEAESDLGELTVRGEGGFGSSGR